MRSDLISIVPYVVPVLYPRWVTFVPYAFIGSSHLSTILNHSRHFFPTKPFVLGPIHNVLYHSLTILRLPMYNVLKQSLYNCSIRLGSIESRSKNAAKNNHPKQQSSAKPAKRHIKLRDVLKAIWQGNLFIIHVRSHKTHALCLTRCTPRITMPSPLSFIGLYKKPKE